MDKPNNIATTTRYSKMISFLPKDCSKLVILDIGAGNYPISKDIKTKKTLLLDGNKQYKPDLIVDLNSQKISLKDGSIDIVIAGEVIEHMLNPCRFLNEINRVLIIGGILILSTPNICSLKNRIRMIFNLIPEHSASHLACLPQDNPGLHGHVGDFNSKSLLKFLEKEGFKLVKIDSNGVILRGKRVFPLFLTPVSFGEILIIKAVKKLNVKQS